MPAELSFALGGLIAPLFIALAVCGAAIWFGIPRLFPAALASAAFIPCLLAYAPAFPPLKLLDDLPYLGLAAFLVFLPFDLKDFPRIVPRGLRWLFSLAAVWLLLKPLFAKWSVEEIAGNVSAGALLWASIWSHIGRISGERRAGILMLAVASIGGGIAIYFASSVLLGQMGIALGVAFASWLLLSGIFPDAKPGHSGLAVAFTLFAGMMLIGAYYSDIPRGIVLLVLSIFAADSVAQMLVQLKPDISPGTAAELTAVLTLPPVAIVIWFSIGDYFLGGS